MRAKGRLALAFVCVALISALGGAIFLAPVLSGSPIGIQARPSATASMLVSPSTEQTAQFIPTATSARPTAVLLPTATALAQPTATPAPMALIPTSNPDAPPGETLIGLINAERKLASCDVRLSLMPILSQVAQAHAEDMARNSRIDHVGSNGATYTQRLDRAGYQYIRRGENLAAGFATPAETLAMWMDEPPDGPHRQNILNCVYREAGVGVARRSDGYHYWVLDLAEPKP